MLECIFSKIEVSTFAVFKTLLFKIYNFSNTSVLPLLRIVTEEELLESWLTFTRKPTDFPVLNLYFVLTTTLRENIYLESGICNIFLKFCF